MLKVKFAKYFVSGMLKDITIDVSLPMANLEAANLYAVLPCARRKTS